MAERVLAAMSGGVDSSVAAALLVEQGYEVIGVTMLVRPCKEERDGDHPGPADDARRVAAALGIPFHVFDLREEFAAEVIAPFIAAYLRGLTPNPCVICNPCLKFGVLLNKARALGASRLATGHYARSGYDTRRGRHLLWKGLDAKKDQSYMLYGLSQEQLAAGLFPLGALSKGEVRALAKARSLPVADKRESQEICFVPDGDYVGFIRDYMNYPPFPLSFAKERGGKRVSSPGFTPGPIIDREGRVLGVHRGLAYYTVGQRRGLGLTAPTPLYVLELRPTRNEVVVGPEEALYTAVLEARDVNWIGYGPPLPRILPVEAKIRYSAAPAAAVVRPRDERTVVVEFTAPQRAIAPGQAAVFYQGDEVVGGGTIQGY